MPREPNRTMQIAFRTTKGKRAAVKIGMCFVEGVDHAGDGAKLAERLYADAPGGTVDHMMLRLLGMMAQEPSHVISDECRKRVKSLQAALLANM